MVPLLTELEKMLMPTSINISSENVAQVANLRYVFIVSGRCGKQHGQLLRKCGASCQLALRFHRFRA
jgi:hypothetical protein